MPFPLVDIRVDDHHALHQTCCLDGAGGDGGVVEDAISLAPACERVVCPLSEVGGEAFLEGGEAGSERAARGAAGAFYHLLRPRKTDAPDLLVGERSRDDPLQVVGGVGTQDLLVRYRAWRRELSPAADPVSRHPLAQHRVLDHREPVALGQG